MCQLKFYVFVLLIAVEIQSGHFISHQKNETAEILYNLANYAIESRQNRYYPYQYHLKPTYPPYYQKPPPGAYGLLQYRPQASYYPQNIRPQYGGYPQRPFLPRPNPQNIMDVLYSISRNDELRCVPRLLCELTSDTISRGRQSFDLPSLPFKINMESIIGLLSTIDAATASPVPVFAKAALLGYISKGNSDSCLTAYPRCPRDADRLVQYLNNYNGGFFRFFAGINPQQNYGGANYGLLNYPPPYPGYNNHVAEQRIQNKPVQYTNNYAATSEGVIFPSSNDIAASFSLNNNRAPKTFIFPSDNLDGAFDEFAFRKPKELPFPINHYYSNELDLQRPLPNHVASPMIFPDRTGTGNLRLDPEELSENYKQSQYNLQNNNFISFNPLPTNEGLYYGGGVPDNIQNDGNRGIFSFPV